MTVRILIGDCREVLSTLPDCSVDSIVCDPPYELGFMGKSWDATGVAFDHRTWLEALRVAKPGAHLLAFGGTKRFHRVACAIEDAGWELRDSIVRIHAGGEVTVAVEDCPWLLGWMFGTGFPKSHNGEWGGTALKPAYEPIIMARKPLIGTVEANHTAHGTGGLNIDGCRVAGEVPDTSRCGGGIPCRHNVNTPRTPKGREGNPSAGGRYGDRGATDFSPTPGPRGGDPQGRWPANLLHDDSDEVLAVFPDSEGQHANLSRHANCRQSTSGIFGGMRPALDHPAREDSGSAARFFWSPKASRNERDAGLDGMPTVCTLKLDPASAMGRQKGRVGLGKNNHPTVKPVALMQYLCRLITPAGGTVLDPFMGSGSTGIAACREGFGFIGIEQSPDYAEIARRRIHADAPLLTKMVE